MPLSQRIVLEALRRRRHSTIAAVADELERSRDAMKHVFATLIKQGYIEQTRKSQAICRGRVPSMYRWTGKTFPPSSEIIVKVEADARAISDAVAALLSSIQAMCRVGRVAA
ncbi:helix-turn-helix domain-containing protein [Caballeronia sp. INSB1]|uniref:MarR family transcriptional regulator n=1 Tax=Caballeronia sp. INSB1 TaxID=2921751 RepID=UPI00203293E2|nr:helix-turn-helix domain-containing protein [Caballeronia sp. INSB1]